MCVLRSSTPRERPALSFDIKGLAALVLALSACTQRTAEVHDEPARSGAPASATFTLAPGGLAAAPSREEPDRPATAAAPDASAPLPPPGAVKAGAPSPSCVKGWITPERGSPLRGAALNMIRTRAGDRFVVEEMRYFVGPEDAEVVGPRGEVERWYVKAYVEQDPRRRQRWLVRRAPIGSGIDAIAPYDSAGYGPGTWRRPDARDESVADPFEHPCQAARTGQRCMGLPPEVLGCLAGT